MHKLVVFFSGCLLSFIASAANDPDSFGRAKRFLDMATAQQSVYYSSTSTPCPAGARCTLIPDSSVSQALNEPDVAHVDLPASAANSILCLSSSPMVQFGFNNPTTVVRGATLLFQGNISIESSALANPALINKVTGEPFNGKIYLKGVLTFFESKTMQPNSSDSRLFPLTKECNSGLISLSLLQKTYGLTAAQARAVFRAPMTVRLDNTGILYGMSYLSLNLGFRLYGD